MRAMAERSLHEARIESALGDRSRARVYAALRDAAEPLDSAGIAARVGLHQNTVRWHLDHLLAAGLVAAERQPAARPGRPRVVYEALQEAVPAAARDDHRLLASALAGALAQLPDGAARAVAAGEEWGRFLIERPEPGMRTPTAVAVAALTAILDDQGFEPSAEGVRLRMCHCPFRELAEKHPDVVCGMHRGLVAGALSELRADVAVGALVPFAEPAACTLELVVS
jgi:predicted ArsR family transcriptional regulator